MVYRSHDVFQQSSDGGTCAYSSTCVGSETSVLPEPTTVSDSETTLGEGTHWVISPAYPDKVAVAAKVEARVDETAVAVNTALVNEVPAPLSTTASFSVSPVARPQESPIPGTNLVHQNTILNPLSSIRCFSTNNTTRPKKIRAEMMSTRSSQSVCSSAVTSCFDVLMKRLSMSCACEADWRLVVEDSVGVALAKASKRETQNLGVG